MPTLRHALLIDDEPLARMELRRLLQAHPHLQVVGEADTLNSARERLAQVDYDVIFLDIQLRGGTGFELLESIPPAVPIIFVTAYDRYAVRAFEVNALDYLLKPVTAERLAETLRRVEENEEDPVASPVLGIEDRVFVKSGAATRFVPVAHLVSVRSCENYTELQLQDGQKLLTLRTLKSWESALPESSFVRIHRQTIVNLQHVRAIVRAEGDNVRFQFDHGLPEQSVSRRRLTELRQRFTAAGLSGMLP